MNDTEFYEYQAQYQLNQAQREAKRCELEKKMFALMKSDKNLHSLKTEKLRQTWRAVCERQKIASKRNEQILNDFREFGEKINELEMKTAKLRNVKKQYEVKVRELYPTWREQVDLAYAKKQLETYNLQKTQPTNSNSQQRIQPALSKNQSFNSESNISPVHTRTPSPTRQSPNQSPSKTSMPESKASSHRMQNPAHFESTPIHLKQPTKQTTKKSPIVITEKSDDSFAASNASTELPPPESFAEKSLMQNPTSKPAVVPVHMIPTVESEDETNEVSSISDVGGEMQYSPSHTGQIMKTPTPEKILHSNSSPGSKQHIQISPTNEQVSPQRSTHSIHDPSIVSNASSPVVKPSLKASSAYQALLGKNPAATASTTMDDDVDDHLENLLSPREQPRYSPDVEDEHDLSEDASDISEYNEHAGNRYIPTAVSAMNDPNKMKKPEPEPKISQNNKVPWDLDSDSDESIGGPNSFLGNTTGNSWKPQNTMEQDDFDFYD